MHGNILSRRAPSRSSPPPSKKRKLDEDPSTKHSVEGQTLEGSKGKKPASSIDTETEGVLKQGRDGKEPEVIDWENLSENERKQVEAWKRGRFSVSIVKELMSSAVQEIEQATSLSRSSSLDTSKQESQIVASQSRRVVITNSAATIVTSLAKMFIGDLVEVARSCMVNVDVPHTSFDDQKTLPIPPEYYLEAWRQLVENNEVPGISQQLDGELSVLVGTPKHECHPNRLI